VAREFTRRTLSGWQADSLFNEVTVVVSELVTNAVCHGLRGTSRSRIRALQLVLLAQEHRMLTAVTDPSDEVPVLSPAGQSAENGRGMRVIEVMSSSWGWTPFLTGGKAVWAAFDVPHGLSAALSQTQQ
jgi:anti-sigma regulatory factor (Ser/Thr protein kinase)